MGSQQEAAAVKNITGASLSSFDFSVESVVVVCKANGVKSLTSCNSSATQNTKKYCRCAVVLEVLGLAALLMVIWGMLLLPIVFYYLPVEVKVSFIIMYTYVCMHVTWCLSKQYNHGTIISVFATIPACIS